MSEKTPEITTPAPEEEKVSRHFIEQEIDKDLRDVNRLVDLMTDLHQIIQEESKKERNS